MDGETARSSIVERKEGPAIGSAEIGALFLDNQIMPCAIKRILFDI